MTHSNGTAIVFFDGVCNLCNASIDFLIRRKSKQLYFASLQGETARVRLGSAKVQTLSSVILYRDGAIYEKSDAVLEIFTLLGGVWTFFQIFRVVPSFIRDWVYDFIASRRYEWFGRRETCRLPTTEERAYFLD